MVSTASVSIDSNSAKEIATRFLEQHHTIIEIEHTVLQDDIWTVIALLSSVGDNIRKIRIDAKTGRIIDWSK
ncbi:MAG TPA: hypothetical protein VGR54_06350 [Nitrosopumilaceae archaeon]|nr:hypothetical protein [Nitrosopumilaceae archaeon]